MMRDCRINTIIEGTSDIMRLYLAREALDPHLSRAGALLQRNASVARKLGAMVRLTGFYGWWAPWQLVAGIVPRRNAGLGELARHARFVDRGSHRLAAALFLNMARFQQRLERRQLRLGYLMDIGTELMAMSATCAYAMSRKQAGDPGAVELADVFCRETRTRINESFRRLRRHDSRAGNALAKGVLEGSYKWMERGVVPCGPDA